jgi:hypothetical protein
MERAAARRSPVPRRVEGDDLEACFQQRRDEAAELAAAPVPAMDQDHERSFAPALHRHDAAWPIEPQLFGAGHDRRLECIGPTARSAGHHDGGELRGKPRPK